ncbi:hypothetical protein [Prescottella equi]|uniref:hypothetical protein n=1 Tax=Rhodococcus hoagii TaxID=43767 RepID=UPI001EEBEE96|nr:hypothetical protein [Prescottella equi]
MNTRTIRRGLTVAALAATAALAMPGTAFAAIVTPTVTAETGINTATFTIAVPPIDPMQGCFGPVVHTEATANSLLNSPTLDIANNPINWMAARPVSPIDANNMNPDRSPSAVNVRSGETSVVTIAYIADGSYVAGTLCMEWVDGNVTYALTQTPFTIGNPDTPEPGGTGSLGSLSFGS